MNKLAIIDYDFTILGGVEKVTEKLANDLSKFYDVYIISINKSNDNIPFKLEDKIKVEFLNNEVSGRLREVVIKNHKKLKNYLKQNNIDVALCMGHYVCFVSVFSKFLTNTKFIFCDHGALINQWSDKKTRLMRKLNSKLSDYTVVLTDRSLEDYKKLFHTSDKKITRIYNCISNELFEKYENSKYNLKSKKIITVGRISEEKGFDLLLEIARELKKLSNDWKWDIYGDGDLKDEIASKIIEYKLNKNVYLKGEEPNVIDKYNDYAVYALPSYREGLPLVLLEAKVNKIPIVSFDVETGPNEIVEDNINGYLIEKYNVKKFAEKLYELLDDDSLREKFSNNSYKNMDKFKEDKIINEWKKLINKLLKEK